MGDRLQHIASGIAENYNKRTWWQNQIANKIIGPVWSRVNKNRGISILCKDWDILLVLDSCRADLFEEVTEIETFDGYKRVYSRGSNTREWVYKNFNGQAKTNCVYVTGNPVVSRNIKTAVHCFLEPWKEAFDPELGTVPPEPVTEAALNACDRFPNKRLIVHYLQPHYPFIGSPDLQYTRFGGTKEVDIEHSKKGASEIWEAVGLGYEDIDYVWNAYANNLDRVLKSMKPLIDKDKKIVITSDHGNMIGERLPIFPMRFYGHGFGLYHPALREVPWAVINEGINSVDGEIEANVTEQLRSLGYIN